MEDVRLGSADIGVYLGEPLGPLPRRNSLTNQPQPKGLRNPPLVGLRASTTASSLPPQLLIPLPVLLASYFSIFGRSVEASVPKVLLEEPLLAPNSSP
jgi:hypothetical protein